ncbi:MAG TPA: hypothetical protein VL793_04605 [Patescibacteria group bacterium]|jgi:hypothetical protein|nr:hypothetical protein [Patescibacteria group bacterium]
MDTSPNPSPSPSDLEQVKEQCAQLQQLVSSLLLILIVISGTLSVFLLREWRFAKAEVNTIEPAAMQLITEDANSRAGVQDFMKKLAEYSRTNQDFGPIALKYRLNDYLPKTGAPLPSTASTNR